MKKVLYFLAAAVFAVAMAACTKPATGGNDNTPGGETAASPKADFDYAVDGLKVTFTNKSTNATAYKWDFGDDETSKEASPEHTYATGGSYSVKLTAANADGEVSSKEVKIDVAGAPKAYFTFEAKKDRAGEFGRVINFDATSSQNATNITWDFGDGSTTEPGTDFKTSHTYAEYGKYTVKAVVVNSATVMDTYQAEVDVVAYNELLKGGSMEEEDAQYWTFESTEVLEDDYATPKAGVLSWVPVFGFAEDGPSGGNGGCLRLSSENQTHDQANNCWFYQAIDVVEGDYLELSAQMKWNENTNDCGLLWFGFVDDPATIPSDGLKDATVEMYNYWNSAYDNPGAEPVPAFDGDFGANADYIAKNGELGLGYSNGGEPVAHYWAQKTGTIYFYVTIRSVWGSCHGPGRYYYFDELSVKVVPAPEVE